jgi:hypothetical protein
MPVIANPKGQIIRVANLRSPTDLEIRPENIVDAILTVRVRREFETVPGTPKETRTDLEQLRVDAMMLRTWAALFAEPKTNWNELVSICTRGMPTDDEKKTHEGEIDSALARGLEVGLVDPNQVVECDLARGAETTRVIKALVARKQLELAKKEARAAHLRSLIGAPAPRGEFGDKEE